MKESDLSQIDLNQLFEEKRGHLHAVAYRMLGSATEAEDAVQEAWLRASRASSASDSSSSSSEAKIENVGGWLTTITARVCLDMLRSRKARREDELTPDVAETLMAKVDSGGGGSMNAEEEAVLADSVGVALLVVLEMLDPAERLAFVLHDMFAMPFEEIASIVGKSSDATRQLASRARRRVQGRGNAEEVEDSTHLVEQRRVVDAFLVAARGGSMEGLLAILDSNVILRPPNPNIPIIRGAKEAVKHALSYSARSQIARVALINGAVGVILAPQGHLFGVQQFKIENGKITEIAVTLDKAKLRDLEIAVLPDEIIVAR